MDRLPVAIAPIVLARGVPLWDDLRKANVPPHRKVAERGVIHVTFAHRVQAARQQPASGVNWGTDGVSSRPRRPQ